MKSFFKKLRRLFHWPDYKQPAPLAEEISRVESPREWNRKPAPEDLYFS